MKKGRIEAFSDGVLAIIVTIMVLELKIPHGNSWSDLLALWPKFSSYILSFLMIIIYWNNHHHVFQTVEKVNGKILWTNGLLLFFLSLVPFGTAWMGESHFDSTPVAFIGIIFLLAGSSYQLLTKFIINEHGQDSVLAKAMVNDIKGTISLVVYILGILISYYYPIVSAILYLLVGIMWLIPDKRIEREFRKN
ncbi:MAG: DUF1211 domain-containing protein [Saprospiraceae bacterium]|jgi:uncharacterized membrane protein|nr:DUF1211 domain-containing protein [Saprospiraceae bacterium]